MTLEKLEWFAEIIRDIAAGRYTDEIPDPSDVEEPMRSLAEAIRLLSEKVEAREHHLEILPKQLEEANRHARRTAIATVSAMAKALAARDAYTQGHAERVGRISGLIAAQLGLSSKETEQVQLAGLLHDIGKIGFPDYLFLPPEGTTHREIMREITQHPTTGAEILKDLDFLNLALSYIRCHHERPDGLGYPEHLKDTEIPLGAKIIAVADSFDAITTDRPYQKAHTFEEALAILKEGSGTKWDPECIAACERVLPKIPPPSDMPRVSGERLLYLADDQPEILLEPGPAGVARMRWIKPGVEFAKYKRLMVDPVVFFFAADSEYKGMNPRELKELADLFDRQVRSSLEDKYPIVQVAGPDVARIRFAITDLRQNRPVLNLASLGLDTDDSTVCLMKSWVGSGATSAELIIIDSLTKTPIAAAKDDRRAGLKERFTKWGSAEDAFQYWADRLRLFLDQAL
jgi:HD-GYP domain-containing protein (c-di-GMP phosphodiesterase class II)